jgi:tetratricopeptide (TPR) repeat protein
VRTEHREEYFDFRQMTELKMLRDLTDGGVTVLEIRRGLDQLRRWLPEAERSLARLAQLEGRGALLVRLEGGRLAEPSGQLRMDFDGARDAPATPTQVVDPEIAHAPSGEDWFEAAVEFEEGDRPEEAAAAYAEALAAGGAEAEAAFNRGNVLFTLGRLDEAVACFEGALDADPRYVEAWNNLASVQLARNEWQRAVEAGCRAVDLARNYADAHFNLAQAYHALGRRDEARRHARLYWKLDPHSEWARLLREDLDLS